MFYVISDSFGDIYFLYWSMRWEVMLLKEGGNVSVMSASALLGYLLYRNMHREKFLLYWNINW